MAVAATLGLIFASVAFTGGVDARTLLGMLTAGGCASVLCGLAAAYVRGRRELLPDSLVGEIGSERSYSVTYCTGRALREACDMTRAPYGAEYVSHDIAEQWRIRNLRAFVQIRNSSNQLCAAFGVLGLRPSFMDQFIAGNVTDHQLRADDICSWPESTKCSQLYLSGVVVLEPTTFLGRKRTRVMLWVMLEYMRQLYGLETRRQLYAIAATPVSSKLMHNLGFVIETPAAVRGDKCDLYRYELTKASWRTLLCEVGNLSSMVTCDFALREYGDESRTASPGSYSSNQEAGSPTTAVITVMFVAGDRGGSHRNQVQIPREFSCIQDAIRGSEHRDAFYIAPPILAASRQTFVEAYRQRPVILHFAGHGDSRSLAFIFDQDLLVTQTEVFAAQLAAILGAFPDPVRLCVLNTCDSASIARYLVQAHVVEAAVGWPGKLVDAAAIAFSQTFYGCLGNGMTLSKSVALAAQSYGTGETPVLCTAEGVNADVIVYVPRGGLKNGHRG